MTRCPQCGQSFPATVKLCPNDGTVLEHESTTATQLGKVLDGKYRLDAFLSQGGMGAVYKATHVMLGKTMAVKLINPDLVTSPDIVRRFQREARAATALNHPNIVGVYDLGQTSEGTLYIAMEFVDGPSLKSAIEKGGSIAPVRTIAILRQVASALAAAHRHNIIHRDLKPHNIMLARTDDGQEIAKLVDFGIAKTFDEATQLTQTGFALGTPQYMAPEQAEGRPVDARSDLYSLGVILYEMLTGDVPFNDNSAPAILIKHIKEAPLPPSLKNPKVFVPPDLEAIAMRCLEKDPARRYQRAEEFAAALEQAAAAIPGAAAAMAATVPISAASSVPPPGAAIWSAPTMAAPAGPATAAPTAQVRATSPQAPTVSASAGQAASVGSTQATRATAAQPQAVAASPQPSSRKPLMTLAIAAVLAIVVGGAAAVIILRQMRPTVESAIKPTDAPSATPAMATPNEPPPIPPQQGSQPPQSAGDAASTTPPPSATAAPSGTPANGPAVAASSVAPPALSSSKGPASSVSNGPALSSSKEPASTAAAARRSAGGAGGRVEAVGKSGTGGGGAEQPPRQPAPAVFPENPAVFFQCGGDAQICAALKSALDEALDKGGLSSTRNRARADVGVAARVDGLQEKVGQQFKTTFAVRTYSIDVTGETRDGDNVSMPPSTTLSFDPQFGSERVTEKARLVAGDIVERVKAFARKRHGG